MTRHVIVGRGAVGTTTAALLAEQGHEVLVVSRSGGNQVTGSVEHVAADASDASVLNSIAKGAVALYNCANPAYHRWPVDWPPLANALLDAAEGTGAVLVTTNNLYAYGPVVGPMAEDLPLARRGSRAGCAHRCGATRRLGTTPVASAPPKPAPPTTSARW